MSMRVVVYDDRYTLMDGSYLPPVPPEQTRAGLGPLLRSIPQGSDETIVILAGEVPDAFNLPLHGPKPRGRGESAIIADHEVLDSLRASGFKAAGLRVWTRVEHEDGKLPAFHVVVYDWLNWQDFPLWAPGVGSLAVNLDLWWQRFGVPWRGTPGVAGTALLRDKRYHRVPKDGGKGIRWQLDGAAQDTHRAWTHSEVAYDTRKFTGDVSGRYTYRFDVRRAHQAAMQSVLLAGDNLKPGPTRFDKTLAGMWLCELEPWAITQVPDPAGYGRADDQGRRWLATPTVQLLEQFHERGVHGGFRIVKSMIGHGTQLMRPLAEALRDAVDDQGEAVVVRDASKWAYKELTGLMASPGGLVYRPDWSAAIVSHTRSNIFRRIARAADAGFFPKQIKTDEITFMGDTPDVPATLAAIFPQGEKLGQFRHIVTEADA